METQIIVAPKPRQRTFQGRVRKPCIHCRLSHLKCDNQFPACERCLRAGRDCHRTPQGINVAINPHPERNRQTRQAFERFVSQMVPALTPPGARKHSFWQDDVLPLTQFHDSVLNASLALTNMSTIPVSEINNQERRPGYEVRRRYREGVDWYCQSVKALAGVVSSKNIMVIMLTNIIYILVEYRQGHFDNLDVLLRSAFAIVHSSREVFLEQIDNQTIFTCLRNLMSSAGDSTTNVLLIPREHWQTAVIVAMSMAAKSPDADFHSYCVEVFNIIYEIRSIIASKDISRFYEVDYRLRSLYRTIYKYKSTDSNQFKARALETALVNSEVEWRTFEFQVEGYVDHNRIEERTNFYLDQLEARVGAGGPPSTIYVNDQHSFNHILFFGWHNRTQSTLQRLNAILDKFPLPAPAIQNMRSYLDILSTVRQGRFTPLEYTLFGEDLQGSLGHWRIQRLGYYIAQRSPR